MHCLLNCIFTALLIQNIWRNMRLIKFSLLSKTQFLIWSQPWNAANQKGSGWRSCVRLTWEWLMKHRPKQSHSAIWILQNQRCHWERFLKYAFKMEKLLKMYIVHIYFFFSCSVLGNIYLVPVTSFPSDPTQTSSGKYSKKRRKI